MEITFVDVNEVLQMGPSAGLIDDTVMAKNCYGEDRGMSTCYFDATDFITVGTYRSSEPRRSEFVNANP